MKVVGGKRYLKCITDLGRQKRYRTKKSQLCFLQLNELTIDLPKSVPLILNEILSLA